MKILSFGEIIWDVYENDAVIGGAPLNFAAHSAKCSAESFLLSAVGNDSYGEEAKAALTKLGVDISLVQTNGYPTGKCIVTLDKNGLPTYRVLTDTAYDNITKSEELDKALRKEGFDALVFGTLAQRSKASSDTLAQILIENTFGEVFCDINLRTDCYTEESVNTCLSYATILKISEEEEVLLHSFDFWKKLSDKDFSDRAKALFELKPRLHTILFTRGEKGATLYLRSGEAHTILPVKTNVISTVGAGDSFGAIFLTLYLQGQNAKKAAETAAKVSSFVVSKKEAVPDYKLSDFI